MWDVMMWPIVACLLLPGLLVYLGMHVVRRGIIFIDIAMAQMASPWVSFFSQGPTTSGLPYLDKICPFREAKRLR